MTTQDTENQAGSHETTQAEVDAKVAAQNAEASGNGSTATDTASTDASASTAAAGEPQNDTQVRTKDEVENGGSAGPDEKRGVSDAA
jgi:hypothetical protein